MEHSDIDARVLQDSVVVAHRLAPPVLITYDPSTDQLELRRFESHPFMVRPTEKTPVFR